MMRSNCRFLSVVFFVKWLLLCGLSVAMANEQASVVGGEYQVQSGDVISIAVWHEQDLQKEVLVRPDGYFSFPLAGELLAQGRTFAEIHTELAAKLSKYIPDIDLTIAGTKLQGNKVYVIGNVNRPGEILLASSADVMQVLSVAGGLSKFADGEAIFVLRRSGGKQQIIPFDYTEVERGKQLEQNIVLQSGDTVVVP